MFCHYNSDQYHCFRDSYVNYSQSQQQYIAAFQPDKWTKLFHRKKARHSSLNCTECASISAFSLKRVNISFATVIINNQMNTSNYSEMSCKSLSDSGVEVDLANSPAHFLTPSPHKDLLTSILAQASSTPKTSQTPRRVIKQTPQQQLTSANSQQLYTPQKSIDTPTSHNFQTPQKTTPAKYHVVEPGLIKTCYNCKCTPSSSESHSSSSGWQSNESLHNLSSQEFAPPSSLARRHTVKIHSSEEMKKAKRVLFEVEREQRQKEENKVKRKIVLEAQKKQSKNSLKSEMIALFGGRMSVQAWNRQRMRQYGEYREGRKFDHAGTHETQYSYDKKIILDELESLADDNKNLGDKMDRKWSELAKKANFRRLTLTNKTSTSHVSNANVIYKQISY